MVVPNKISQLPSYFRPYDTFRPRIYYDLAGVGCKNLRLFYGNRSTAMKHGLPLPVISAASWGHSKFIIYKFETATKAVVFDSWRRLPRAYLNGLMEFTYIDNFEHARMLSRTCD